MDDLKPNDYSLLALENKKSFWVFLGCRNKIQSSTGSRVSKSGHGPVFCHFWPRPRPLQKIYCTEWARLGPVNRSCTRPVTAIGKRPVLTGLAHSEGHSCPRLGLRVTY